MAKFTQLFKEIQDNSITPIKTTFCGDLTTLETTAKDNLVNAINELKNSSSGGIELLWSGDSKNVKFSSINDYQAILVIGVCYAPQFSIIIPTIFSNNYSQQTFTAPIYYSNDETRMLITIKTGGTSTTPSVFIDSTFDLVANKKIAMGSINKIYGIK